MTFIKSNDRKVLKMCLEGTEMLFTFAVPRVPHQYISQHNPNCFELFIHTSWVVNLLGNKTRSISQLSLGSAHQESHKVS